MIKLQRLGHVAIAVRDLARSKDFYTRILGFRLLEEDADHGGVFLSLASLGNTLDLFQAPDAPGGEPPETDPARMNRLGVRHTAFAVASEADLEDAYHALQAHGVEILRALDHQSQKSIYFHDPDGNLLEIVWERPDALEIFARGRKDEDRPFSFSPRS